MSLNFTPTERPAVERPRSENPMVPVAKALADDRTLTLRSAIDLGDVKKTKAQASRAGADLGVTIRSKVETVTEGKNKVTYLSLWAIDRIQHKPHERSGQASTVAPAAS